MCVVHYVSMELLLVLVFPLRRSSYQHTANLVSSRFLWWVFFSDFVAVIEEIQHVVLGRTSERKENILYFVFQQSLSTICSVSV